MEDNPFRPLSPADAVVLIDRVAAHLWIVRTFIKHSPEVEDFPELMQAARTIFDVVRAIETRRESPELFVRMLSKKMAKLRRAAEQFRTDAAAASDHTNWRQAVLSFDAAVATLDEILARVTQ